MTRTFTVRSVTGNFNRISNVIAGTAPAAGTLYLDVGRPELALNSYSPLCEVPTPVSSSGQYSYDTTNCATGYDAIGGDEAFATWFSSAGDRVTREMHAPYVEANLGSSKVDGFVESGRLDRALSARSERSRTRGAGQATADAFGQWRATFRKSGHPVQIRPNDMITGNWPGQGYKVRDLTISLDTTANTVQGFCTPYTAFGLLVRWSDSYDFLDDVTNSTGLSGVLTISGHQLAAGDKISFVCMRPNGDRTKLAAEVPPSRLRTVGQRETP